MVCSDGVARGQERPREGKAWVFQGRCRGPGSNLNSPIRVEWDRWQEKKNENGIPKVRIKLIMKYKVPYDYREGYCCRGGSNPWRQGRREKGTWGRDGTWKKKLLHYFIAQTSRSLLMTSRSCGPVWHVWAFLKHCTLIKHPMEF